MCAFLDKCYNFLYGRALQGMGGLIMLTNFQFCKLQTLYYFPHCFPGHGRTWQHREMSYINILLTWTVNCPWRLTVRVTGSHPSTPTHVHHFCFQRHGNSYPFFTGKLQTWYSIHCHHYYSYYSAVISGLTLTASHHLNVNETNGDWRAATVLWPANDHYGAQVLLEG